MTGNVLSDFHSTYWEESIPDEVSNLTNNANIVENGVHGMDIDQTPDLNFIPGCGLLSQSGIYEAHKIWIRAEYIRVYDYIEKHFSQSHRKTPAVVLTGQPGIGGLITLLVSAF